jgi:MFS family permease
VSQAHIGSIFFSAATAAGAFGGLLARGISEMDGVAGLGGWAWIFILEGLITFVVAIIAYFVMNDYPSTAKFLNEYERKEVVRRLHADRNALSDEWDMKFFWAAVKDWKIWVHMFITIGYVHLSFVARAKADFDSRCYTPLYSISLFLPTIVRTLGYTNETAQLMTVPPYVAACICCITGGWLADRLQTRGLFMIGFFCTALIGLIMLISTDIAGVKYAG